MRERATLNTCDRATVAKIVAFVARNACDGEDAFIVGCGYQALADGGGGGGLGSLRCSAFSFHTSPPSKNSFFQMGTVAFSSSMA